MFEDHAVDESQNPQAEAGGDARPAHPAEPTVPLDDTRPVRAVSPDDVETAELPGELGEPTIAMPRVPTGATPTANLPRTVPPPQRPGYVPPRPVSHPPSVPPSRGEGPLSTPLQGGEEERGLGGEVGCTVPRSLSIGTEREGENAGRARE